MKMTPIEITTFAGELYEAYCKAVGGKAYDGNKLPTWEEFRADPKKAAQADAWEVVATLAGSRPRRDLD